MGHVGPHQLNGRTRDTQLGYTLLTIKGTQISAAAPRIAMTKEVVRRDNSGTMGEPGYQSRPNQWTTYGTALVVHHIGGTPHCAMAKAAARGKNGGTLG